MRNDDVEFSINRLINRVRISYVCVCVYVGLGYEAISLIIKDR